MGWETDTSQPGQALCPRKFSLALQALLQHVTPTPSIWREDFILCEFSCHCHSLIFLHGENQVFPKGWLGVILHHFITFLLENVSSINISKILRFP